MQCIRTILIGTGGYLPEKIVTNKDLEDIIDTSDAWIKERSGIESRHKIADNQTTSDMAYLAALRAIEDSGIDKNTIDMIICATVTPDRIFPSVASMVQHKLNIANLCPAFDVSAACAGFVYALSMADNFIKTGFVKTILVIGADAMTRLLDYTDRTTCVLFGDGAGAMIFTAQQGNGTKQDTGILATTLHTNGALGHILGCKGGAGTFGNPFGYLEMEGKEVFKTAITALSDVMYETLERAGIPSESVDYVVPHQANRRIMDATAKKIGITEDKVISTIAHHGNTSSASVPLAFDVAKKDGHIQKGHLVLMEAIGGGMAWGGCLLRV